MTRRPVLRLLPGLLLFGLAPLGWAQVERVVPTQVNMLVANGELAARENSILGPPSVRRVWNYTIAFMLPEGTAVKQGTLVLGFDTDQLQTRRNDKQGQLNEKQSELRRLQVNNKETLEQLAITGEEFKMELDKARRKAELPSSVLAKNIYQENQLLHELAQHQLASNRLELEKRAFVLKTEEAILESEIRRIQAELDDINGGIDKMQVKAPRDGVVLHLTDRSGNKFSTGDQARFGQRIIEIPDLSQMIVKLEVRERDLGQVRAGQRIRFRLDASPEQQFNGVIESISRVVRTRSAQQPAMVVDAVAVIDQPDMSLMRPGMRINAEILSASEVSLSAAP